MITLTEQQIAGIQRHGEAEYPNECCGAILGRFDGHDKIAGSLIPISNMREDAAKHNRFLIRPEEFLHCEKTAQKQGLEMIGFYHSHPDHPAVPSQYDLDHAFPVYSYLIVSVIKHVSGDLTSWELKNDRSRFDSEGIIVVE
jgi:proteasome lid subunit RPN8/RPN11